jgi:hypothetical protein
MQMVKRFLLILAAFWVALLLFAPWRELYFYAEKQLTPYQIQLRDATIEEIPGGLRLLHPELYWQGIDLARIDRITFRTILLVSELRGEKLSIQKAFQRFAPVTVKRFLLRYYLWSPRQISIRLEGSFGILEGHYDIPQRALRLTLVKEEKINALRPYMKHRNGVWVYERRF